jgi:hypothetical protein
MLHYSQLIEGPLSVTEMAETFAQTGCNYASLTNNKKSINYQTV